MEEGIQRAGMAKRISAGLLDIIAVSIIATLFAWIISLLSGYDGWNKTLEDSYSRYEEKYGIEFRITEEEYLRLAEEKRKADDEAYQSLIEDEKAMKAYNMVSSLMVLTLSLGIFLSILLWEFIVPLFLRDGRTLGKLIFGLAVMRTNSVRVSHISLFIRSILGKYAIETMIPALILFMMAMNMIGIVGPLVIFLILLFQVILIIKTRNNQLIHCILSDTVVVDYGSQRIFESEEALLEEKKREAKERAERDPYFS